MNESGNFIVRRTRNPLFSLSVTLRLIVLNVVLFFIGFILLGVYGLDFLNKNIALVPNLILSGQSLWTPLTSMFMHASFFHLFANMFSLFFVGSFLERLIGGKRFFWVYIISGLIGSVFFVVSGLIFSNSNIPGVGASGAIFGILGVLAVVVPRSKISLIIGPLVLLIVDAVFSGFVPATFLPTFHMIINVLILLSIFAIFSFNSSFRKLALPVSLQMWSLPIIAIVPLVVIDFFVDLPIGNSAHIGGLVVGLVYGFYLRQKFPNKTKMLSKHFT